jgi:hypothetical protein
VDIFEIGDENEIARLNMIFSPVVVIVDVIAWEIDCGVVGIWVVERRVVDVGSVDIIGASRISDGVMLIKEIELFVDGGDIDDIDDDDVGGGGSRNATVDATDATNCLNT